MTARPILFSGEMVRAILAGRKTQTRRLIKPEWWRCLDAEDEDDRTQALSMCPYGQPGDTLWVRETWRHFGNEARGGRPIRAQVIYRADDSTRQCGSWPSFKDAPTRAWWNTGKKPWTPAIHMPRWASRITLPVASVRVEPLQAITEDDARAEGVEARLAGPLRMTAVQRFTALWNSINGKRAPWSSNPWVWVVGFEVPT